MQRFAIVLVVGVLALGACSDAPDGDAATSPPSPAAETTSVPLEPTTTDAGSTTTPSTTRPDSTTATTAVTTTAPTASTAPTWACPDLQRTSEDSDVDAVHLAAWTAMGEATWEIPIGNVLPAWAVWSDEVILGFPDGELVGIDVATCDSWAITIAAGISDLVVMEQGMILVVNGGRIAAFSGRGFGAWRHQAIDSVYQFVGDNAGVAVFVDQFGDITGFEQGGDVAFVWGGASEGAAVAVSETYVYRATGAEVAARPVAGGAEIWALPLSGVEALFAVPGTLLARDAAGLHAIEPQTGEVRWTVPFQGEIAGPAALSHDEIHIVARDGSIGFDTLWHLDPADGSTVFRGTAPPTTEWFPEMDDALLLQVGEDGTVSGIDMLQRVMWAVETGANRISRFTQVEVARTGTVVTLSYDAERF